MQVSKQARAFADLVLQHYGCKDEHACKDSACSQHVGHGSSPHSSNETGPDNSIGSIPETNLISPGSGDGLIKANAGAEADKWQALTKQIELEENQQTEKKEEEKNQVWGCSQDHRKERDIYERPNEEKMKIAEDFKKQGDTAYKLQKLEEADYNYQKVIEKL
jgi:hypothetical protein